MVKIPVYLRDMYAHFRAGGNGCRRRRSRIRQRKAGKPESDSKINDIRVKIPFDSNSIKLQEEKIMQLKSQEMRKLAPELDPLRIGTGWTKEDLGKVQVMVESTYGDSHPGSGHLNILVEEVRKGIASEGGFGARYHCTDICDGESQGTDGINYSLASREMIANMIEIHANATPFDAGVYLSSCDKGVPGNLMGLARVNIPSVFVPGGTMNAGPEMLTLEQLGMYSAKFERGEIDEEIQSLQFRRNSDEYALERERSINRFPAFRENHRSRLETELC